MSELEEALNRAAYAVRDGRASQVRLALLAIVDTLVEIAAVLPAPHTVPKEPDDAA